MSKEKVAAPPAMAILILPSSPYCLVLGANLGIPYPKMSMEPGEAKELVTEAA